MRGVDAVSEAEREGSPPLGRRQGVGGRGRRSAVDSGAQDDRHDLQRGAGAELQAVPRKAAPRKAEGRRQRIHRRPSMKLTTCATAGYLRRSRWGRRLSFFQRPLTAESIRAKP